MADGKTYGINFPFRQSIDGKYLSLSQNPDEEIRSNLIHLILSRKGSRYYLPDFGTRIYEFIFEPMDGASFDLIRDDIKNVVNTYIPNVQVNNISIEPYNEDDKRLIGNVNKPNEDQTYDIFDIYRLPGRGTEEYTAKLRIDYTIQNDSFESRDFIIINI